MAPKGCSAAMTVACMKRPVGRPSLGGRPASNLRARVFRMQTKKVGMIWSCPVQMAANPIGSKQVILDFLKASHGEFMYCIAQELHASGKLHFHAHCVFDTKLDIVDVRHFDICGVHANLLVPGLGWLQYVRKHGDLLTNIPEKKSICAEAIAMQDPGKGLAHIALLDASLYLRYSAAFERGLRSALQATRPLGSAFMGPYQPTLAALPWNSATHSLLVWGASDVGKTQFIRYFAAHKWGSYSYVRAGVDSLRGIDFNCPFVFDEADFRDLPDSVSREITDISDGGCIRARYNDILIPPGVERIFISNYERPFANPANSVYGRRVISYHME